MERLGRVNNSLYDTMVRNINIAKMTMTALSLQTQASDLLTLLYLFHNETARTLREVCTKIISRDVQMHCK